MNEEEKWKKKKKNKRTLTHCIVDRLTLKWLWLLKIETQQKENNKIKRLLITVNRLAVDLYSKQQIQTLFDI
jgi:hypothetical protein